MTRWREIIKFSKSLLITNILGIFRDRGATFVVGKISGAAMTLSIGGLSGIWPGAVIYTGVHPAAELQIPSPDSGLRRPREPKACPENHLLTILKEMLSRVEPTPDGGSQKGRKLSPERLYA